MWLAKAFCRLTFFPDPVILNLFAAPRLVFSLGTRHLLMYCPMQGEKPLAPLGEDFGSIFVTKSRLWRPAKGGIVYYSLSIKKTVLFRIF
jgi:hypothetical protein